MSILRVDPYDKSKLLSMLNYILKLHETAPNFIYPVHTMVGSIYDDIERNHIRFGKNNGIAFFDIIIRFDEGVDTSISRSQVAVAADEIANLIANFHGRRFAILATHFILTSPLPHFHIICDSLDFDTGQRLNLSKRRLYELKAMVSSTLESVGISPIRVYQTE